MGVKSNFHIINTMKYNAFISLAYLLREQKVAGSNPATPTIKTRKA